MTGASITVAVAVAILASATWPIPAAAQAADPQPYAGFQSRPIKALSDTQIDDYLNGRGMSLALAAELNGYPGPRHVLDLAEALDLSPAQRTRTDALFVAMQAEAAELGAHIVAEEAELERMFGEAAVSPAALERRVTSIARLQGRLRYTHLRFHLAMYDLLSAEQIDAYARLRGYGPDAAPNGHGGGHGH